MTRPNNKNSRRKFSPTLSFVLYLIGVFLAIYAFGLVYVNLLLPLPVLVCVFFLIMLVLMICTYLIGTRLTRYERTVKNVELNETVPRAKNKILSWLDNKGFEIEEKGNYIKAIKGRRGTPKLHFELTLKKKGHKCLLHGEFYTKGWGDPERDFQEKVWVGRVPRKKGFKLMSEFLIFLKNKKPSRV